MKSKYIVPACYHYITNQDKTIDYNKVVSVSFSAYKNINKSLPEIKNALFTYQSIGVSLQEKNVKITELSCYEVIKEYQCSFICATCPYSSKYRNKNEHDETLLISYAMQSIENFNYIHNFGCHAASFKSVLFIGKESDVPIIPLLSLIYDYLSNIAINSGFDNIQKSIFKTLKETNKSKLSSKDYDFLQHYIQNIYSSGKKLKKQDMDGSLIKLKLKVPTKKIPIHKTDKCLVGLIPESDSFDHRKNKLPKEIQEEKKIAIPPQNPLSNHSQKAASVPHENTSTFESNLIIADISPKPKPEEKENPGMMPKANVLDNRFDPSSEEYIDLTKKTDLKDFKRQLLLTPYLPLEILINMDDNKQYFVLYLNKHFYFFSLKSTELFLIIMNYSCKNKYRKLLCMYGDLLTYWMHAHDHHVNNICSMKFLYNMLQEYKGEKLTHNPLDMIRNLLEEEVQNNQPIYPVMMTFYSRIHSTLVADKMYRSEQFIQQQDFEKRIYQYLLQQYVFKTKKGSYLFSVKGDHWAYDFSYTADEPLHIKDHQVIRYVIKCKSGLPKLFIKECIYYLTFHSLNVKVLYFDQSSFVVIVPKKQYKQCSTSTNELINIRAKSQRISPVCTTEIIEYS